MRIKTILSAFLLSSAVSAKGTGSKTISVKAECGEVERLTRLVDLANNQTLLASKTKNNSTRAQAIQAEASSEAARFQNLTSNTTLMADCAVIQAEKTMVRDCDTQKSIERLQKLVANSTELATKTKNNATKAAELTAKAFADAPKLAALRANATLQAFCADQNTKAQCAEIIEIQREEKIASNQKALNDIFKGNATRIANFHAKASQAAITLQALQGNTTLVNFCNAEKSTTSTTTNGATGTSSSSTVGIGKSTVAALFVAIALALGMAVL